MQYTVADIITTILDIVGYQGNKVRFADEFVDICYQQGMHDYLISLPTDKQKELMVRLNKDGEENLDKMIAMLSEGENKEGLYSAITQASSKTLQEYIETVKPHLTEIQKDTLYIFLEGLKDNGKDYLFGV